MPVASRVDAMFFNVNVPARERVIACCVILHVPHTSRFDSGDFCALCARRTSVPQPRCKSAFLPNYWYLSGPGILCFPLGRIGL